MAKIKNIRPRINQAKEHIKARVQKLIPLDYFQINNYDEESIAESQMDETSFGGEETDDSGSLGSEQYTMTETVKGGFKAMLKADPNMTLSERVASAKQKLQELFNSKRGIIEDSVKHYGTRQVYNAIEQALPRPINASGKVPNLALDAIAKDVRKEVKNYIKNITGDTWSTLKDTFQGKTRRPPTLHTKIKASIIKIREIRAVNDVDNILAYEDEKRKDKKFQAPVRS